MISVQAVSLSFQHDRSINHVLHDINFHVGSKGSCSIIGPSGCGKTSLLFLLAGLIKPDSGVISIEGTPRTGTILQNYGLFPWKTVSQNIGLGLLLKKEPKNRIAKKTAELVEEMGLQGFENYYPNQLSGGMQQRVALARALAVDPQILFMDEPLSSLDALTRERLQNLILQVQKTKQIATILVTHSIEEAVFLGKQVIVLDKRPATVLNIVENPGAGDPGYREEDAFFKQCRSIRTLLREENNGQQA